jgi:antitoxin HicB
MEPVTYTIELEPLEEGGFAVSVPALPGCLTWGISFDHAVAMAHEAIQGFVETLRELGQPIPVETKPAGRGKVTLLFVPPTLA